MRNPQRIYEVMALITLIWEKCPDIRFNQLVNSLQMDFTLENPKYIREYWSKDESISYLTTYVQHRQPDLFSLEDEVFIEFLKTKLKGDNNE
jgi:uncharacterized protein YihD (DUF1040 family)